MCDCAFLLLVFFFFFSSRRRHTRCREVSWARRCVQETDDIPSEEDIWKDDQENIKMEEAVSSRLAIVNFDFEQVSAKDLYAIFASFCKEQDSLQKIEVYLSQYGKEKIKNDSLYGPTDIWKKEETPEEKNQEQLREKKKNKHGFDPVALRKYELQKLKYYFAVAYFKNEKVAQNVYDEYDGFEYELSLIHIPSPRDLSTSRMPSSA
eukprot:TRINITY_DN21756_c0_g1_i2.p1 TRINITY_DN21756_c0_g1~~TRINITY_DN21756_c0_g1_i2.p1  ORF type:complete len:207 (+),score=79.93 TRINITY_DN21756_c0_g1_i2:40-660(+)